MKKDIFTTTDILLPNLSAKEMEAWSVVACDQFSSEKEYWERVKKFVGDKPSTLKMIIPEAYLEEVNEDVEIKKICETMTNYVESGLFVTIEDSFIYVERMQADGRVRRGVVGAVELDEYDFASSESAIRASEGTVLERLPPRVAVRKVAPLELPHIITFIDDKEKSVIEPLAGKTCELPLLYDFKLMEGGGHIKGYRVVGENAKRVSEALKQLGKQNDMLMIMGDGNHSLAAAKVYWDELKKTLNESERENHPASRAIVEMSNVYDPAIDFEAIHRIIFGIDVNRFIKKFEETMPKGDDYVIEWVTDSKRGNLNVKAECIGDLYAEMQEFVDSYIKDNGGVIDYIHGDETTVMLAKQDKAVGLLLPSMDKKEFFETVDIRGVFPRKSFSVGHSEDKRYYLECREIRE